MKNPETDSQEHAHRRSPADLPVALEIAEEQLESFDSSWVDFLRNIRGDEPFESLPWSFKALIVVGLFTPLFFILFVEWTWRQVIPLWISMPATAVAAALAVLRRWRRKVRSSQQAPARSGSSNDRSGSV